MFKLELLHLLKICGIFRITAGPAALNIGNPQIIEQVSNLQFIGNGKRNAFALGTVAQRRIVDGNSSHTGSPG